MPEGDLKHNKAEREDEGEERDRNGRD